ncbi:hypothetical protein A2U01_0088528, partial [Trifolium medium]|nr:hypothetical protein [Trifolium medium]
MSIAVTTLSSSLFETREHGSGMRALVVMVGDGGWWWSVMEVVTVVEANKRNGGQAARQ